MPSSGSSGSSNVRGVPDPVALARDEHALAALLGRAPTERRTTLVANVVAFCRLLRASGIEVTVGRALDATRALRAIGVSRRDDVRAALAATLLWDFSQRPLFDALFNAFWSPVTPPPALLPPPRGVGGSRPLEGPAVAQQRRAMTGDVYGDETARAVPEGQPRSFSDADLVTTKDFASLRPDELREVRRLIRRIAEELSVAVSRRDRSSRHGGAVDLRRSLRRAARAGGDLRELSRRRRRHQRTDVVLLADVSGSMDVYTQFLVQFVYGLQQELHGVSTFVFSTRLFEVTQSLRARSFEEALRLLQRNVDGWSGGTQIGASLADFNRGFARQRVHRHTIVIVLSDGWDRGESAELALEMASLRRRARRLIWLNPLLGHEGYQPLTQGMLAALPHCDDFMPAHNVDSLERFGKRLLRLAASR